MGRALGEGEDNLHHDHIGLAREQRCLAFVEGGAGGGKWFGMVANIIGHTHNTRQVVGKRVGVKTSRS